MSTAKHTPGPWVVGTETRGDEICTIHGVPSQPTEDGEGQRWVYIHYPRVIGKDWHYPTESEKLANAHLIAAAPELLQCAKLLESLCVWLLHACGPDSAEGQEAAFRLSQAIIAIAKATKDG